MAKQRLKVTVLKKLSSKEVYGQPLPEVAEDMSLYCDGWKWGKSLLLKSQGRCPPAFAPGPGTTSIRR